MRSGPDLFSPESARLPPCGVCGYQATGYHYGVNTCEACKVFFHRSLRFYKTYQCRAYNNTEGLCEFIPGKRKSCQYCRFQRCLKAGMSKDAIKTGRYSVVKKRKDNREIEHIAKSSKMELDSLQSTQMTPNNNLPREFCLQTVVDDEEDDYLPFKPQPPFPTLNDLIMDVPGCTPSSSSSFTPVPMDSSSPNTYINTLFSDLSSEYPGVPTPTTSSPATSAGSGNRAYSENLASPSMLTMRSEGSHNWDNWDSDASPHDDETQFLGNISGPIKSDLSPCSSTDFFEDRPSSSTHQISPAINSGMVNLTPVSSIPNGSLPSSELPGHTRLPVHRDVSGVKNTEEPVTCSTGTTAQGEKSMDTQSTPQPKAKMREESSYYSYCSLFSPYLARMRPDGASSKPSSVPFPASDPLLPSQIPQLYSDLEAVLRILTEAHKQNLADFSNVPREEILKLQMKHVESCKLRVSTFGKLPLLSTDEYDAIYAMTGIDVDNRIPKSDMFLERVAFYCRALARFARCIPGFPSLELDTQVNLIESTRVSAILMTVYPLFNLELGIGLTIEGNWLYKDELSDFNKDCFYNAMHLCDKLQKLNPSLEEIIIMKGMVIMSTDAKKSMDSPLADAIHWQLYHILAYITARRHSNPHTVLADYMNIMAEAKRVGKAITDVVELLRSEKHGTFFYKPIYENIFRGATPHKEEKDEKQSQNDKLPT